MKRFNVLFLIPLVLAMASAALAAAETPVWWSDFEKTARAEGYQLLTDHGLKAALDSGDDYLLLDVRPKYEFNASHLNGAVNLEFHEGHRRTIEPELAEAFKKLAGPDPSRRVIVYCRSFR